MKTLQHSRLAGVAGGQGVGSGSYPANMTGSAPRVPGDNANGARAFVSGAIGGAVVGARFGPGGALAGGIVGGLGNAMQSAAENAVGGG